jgi:hypothetical protein
MEDRRRLPNNKNILIYNTFNAYYHTYQSIYELLQAAEAALPEGALTSSSLSPLLSPMTSPPTSNPTSPMPDRMNKFLTRHKTLEIMQQLGVPDMEKESSLFYSATDTVSVRNKQIFAHSFQPTQFLKPTYVK